MYNIIAICNQKGGVGKTTTAINLSACLANSSKKTLLIDIDPQGNATSGIGIDKHKIKTSIYNVIVEEKSIREAILQTRIEGLEVIPSGISLTGAEVELVAALGREYKLKRAIQAVVNDFDFVIIDCPPSLGLLTINALAAANSIIIPVQCEYYALEGVGQLVNTFNLIRDNINPVLVIMGVLLTMADYRTNLTSEVIKEIRGYFKETVFSTVIPRNIKISESPGFGKPLCEYDPDSIGARMYKELAKELLAKEKDSIPIDNAKIKAL